MMTMMCGPVEGKMAVGKNRGGSPPLRLEVSLTNQLLYLRIWAGTVRETVQCRPCRSEGFLPTKYRVFMSDALHATLPA